MADEGVEAVTACVSQRPLVFQGGRLSSSNSHEGFILLNQKKSALLVFGIADSPIEWVWWGSAP